MSKKASAPSWAQIRGLLDRVLDLPEAERTLAVHEANEDTDLKRAVLSMLAAYEEETEPFAQAAVDVSGLLGDHWSPGDAIGAYRLIDRVGEGGMGTVFIAQRADDAYSKQVAVKLIRRGWASDEEIRRFRSERQILADLEHPSIARLLDGGETPQGQPFLVMEFVDGQPIDAHCREHELGLEGMLSLFLEVCRAVQYAHQSLIVHRDLKPSNILVASTDGDSTQSSGRVKLLDFGIAKILEGSDFSGPVERTRTGSAPMTPAYASPEQVSGQPITTATDVYSLGMLLYLLLTGDLPYRFDGRDMPAIVNAVVHREATAPSSRLRALDQAKSAADGKTTLHRRVTAKTLRGDLDAIVLKALAKEPSERYATAEQLADDLDRFLDHRPVRARRDTWIYRGSKFLNRYRVGLTAAAATFAILVASLFVLLHQQESLVEERNRALELQRRSETVTGHLVELFRLPDPSTSLGAQITARELLDKSSRTIDKDLADQPRLLPDLLSVLAKTYAGLGQIQEARSLIDRALRLTRAQSEAPRLPDLLFQLSDVLSQDGRYGAARVVVNEALVRLDGERNPEQELLFTQSLALQGYLDLRLGRLDIAHDVLQRSLRLAQKNEDAATLAQIYEYIGELHGLRGEHEPALEGYAQALELRRQLHDERHPKVLLLKAATASLTTNVDTAAGELLLRQAIADQRQLFGGSHPMLAIGLNNLGRSLWNRGEIGEAEQHLNESLAMKRQLFGDSHPSLAVTLGNLSNIKGDAGETEAAIELCEQALAIFEESLGTEHADYGFGLANLGKLYIDRGDFDTAKSLLEEGLRVVVDSVGTHHERTLLIRTNLSVIEDVEGRPETARDILRAATEEVNRDQGDPPGLSRALLNLADLENRLGNKEVAADLYYEIAERDGDRTQSGLFALTHASRWAFKQERWLEAENLAQTAVQGFAALEAFENWRLSALRTQGLALLEQGRLEEARAVLEDRHRTIQDRLKLGLATQKGLDKASADLERLETEATKMGKS